MKILIRHIFLFLAISVSAFRLSAQIPVDTIADAITAFARSQKDTSPIICSQNAIQWVESIPLQELLRYVQSAEKILYTPQCTPCNRHIYKTLIATLLQSKENETVLMRYRYQYNILSHNNEGETATDFPFFDTQFQEYSLSQIQTPYTLLIFNDPECDECAALRQRLTASRQLSEAIRNKTLSVIAIYPDQATDMWKEQMLHYPPEWIKGFSEDVSDLYDLRKLPATYLLDHSHTILLRDSSVQEITEKITAKQPALPK